MRYRGYFFFHMNQKNIYQSKFASVYDQIYGDNFYRQYIFFIKKIVNKNKLKNVKILDLACGTGRLIKTLNQELDKKNPMVIEGADASPAMIKIAKKRNKKVKFYNQKFANLTIGKKYDIITSTFDSINYILKKQDLKRGFDRIFQHLNPGGIFIFDFNTDHKKVPKNFTRENVIYQNLIKGKYWHIKITVKKGNKNYIERHKQHLYSLKEIKSILSESKFKINSVYSDLNEKPNRFEKNSRLFVVAQKIEK